MSRRLVGAVLAAVVVAAGGACSDDRADDRPRWAGAKELSAERRTVTELTVRTLPATRVKAAVRPFVGDVAVNVAPTTPPVVIAERPMVPGELPEPQEAKDLAERVVRALGLDPAEWTVTETATTTARTVKMAPKAELVVFPMNGSDVPEVLVEVDGEGVQHLRVPLIRLTGRQVEVMSEQEAFARVTRPGEYRQIWLVLVYDGSAAIRPHYDIFWAGMRPRRPFLAVLTP